MNKHDRTRLWAGILAFVFATLAFWIFSILQAHAEEVANAGMTEVPVRAHYGPSIPQCDKELWLRIKDRCK